MFFKNLNSINLNLKLGDFGKNFYIKNCGKIIELRRGGRSGNIYFFFDDSLKNINYYIYNNSFSACSGCDATSKGEGKNGRDLILRIPGKSYIEFNNNSILKNINDKLIKVIKSSKIKDILKKNIIFILKLKFFFDILILGKSNSGKSSLFLYFLKYKFNKISIYKFTTNMFFFFLKFKKKIICLLDNLGIIKKIFLNISDNINSFNNFKIFFHIIRLNNLNIFGDFKIFNFEIYKFQKNFFYKPRILIFTKIDLVKKKYFEYFIKKFFFKKYFNWKFLIFFSTIFCKKFIIKIFKILYRCG